jgi:prophage DNA circulation protein
MAFSRNLRPASFRGIQFEVESRSVNGGRRLAEHTYPYRDDPNPEDMGRKARGLSVEAFLFGSSYRSVRDQLVSALEKKGSGEYVDPWGNSYQLVVADYTLSENLREGGYCKISIQFREAGVNPLHSTAVDSRYAVDNQADESLSAVLDDFSAAFNASGANDLATAAEADVGTVAGFLQQMMTRSDFSGGTLVERFRFLRSLVGWQETPSLTVPATLATETSTSIQSALSFANTPEARLTAAQQLMSFGNTSSQATGTTDVLAQQAQNQAAFMQLVQNVALIEKSQAAADVPLSSYEDAAALKNTFSKDFETALLTASDTSFRPLSTLRQAVLRNLTERGTDLKHLVDFTPAETRSALTIAYDLYGDASRENEILARNAISHPGFVPGGKSLKVLRDA